MIDRIAKKDCYGCMACLQVCPVRAISLESDKEGFVYPMLQKESCTSCRLCLNVCPAFNHKENKTKPKIFWGYHTNNAIKECSSSGGIFTCIASNIIEQGGVVFGATFNNSWMVEHSSINNIADIKLLRGSKYLQSDINSCYNEVEHFLKENKKVLFSGTPCQVGGLKAFLRKEYMNLYCIDFICHGVPSPLVWKRYIQELTFNITQLSPFQSIDEITFRNKSISWKEYSLMVNFKTGHKSYLERYNKDPYLRGFIHNLYLRPSCHHCKFKGGKNQSDITLADYWQIEKLYSISDEIHHTGVSMIIVNTEKINIHNLNNIKIESGNIQDIQQCNPAYYVSVNPHKNRERFFNRLNETDSVHRLIDSSLKHSLYSRIMYKLKTYIFKA